MRIRCICILLGFQAICFSDTLTVHNKGVYVQVSVANNDTYQTWSQEMSDPAFASKSTSYEYYGATSGSSASAIAAG